MPRKGSSIVYINKITKENSTYNVATLHQVKSLLAVQKCLFKKSISPVCIQLKHKASLSANSSPD